MRILLSAVVLGLFAFAQSSVGSESEPPAYEAEEVVVTGTRYALPEVGTLATKLPLALRDTPASVAVVPQSLVAAQGSQVLGEALTSVSGINAQSTFNISDYLVIRGFDSLSSGMVLFDGAAEPEVSFYNTYNIERIEVLKGPGAFLYGGNPLSGTVNLVRKQARFGADFARISSRFGRFGSYGASVDAGSASTDFAVRLNAMARGADNYRDDKKFSEFAINPAASLLLGERADLRLNIEYYSNDYRSDAGLPLIGPTVADVPRTRSYQSPFDKSTQDILRLRLDGQVELSEHLTIRDKLYFTDFDWPSAGSLMNGVFPGETGQLEVLRTLLLLDDHQRFVGNQLEAVVSTRKGGLDQTLLVGLELARLSDEFTLDVGLLPSIALDNPVESAAKPFFLVPGQSTAADARTLLAAPYATAHLQLTPTLQGLIGARVDLLDYEDARTATSRTYRKLSPMLGVTWSPLTDLQLYANLGSAFAPPSSQVVGEREAEKSRQYETGARRQWLGGKVRGALAAYHLEKKNIAIRDQTGIFHSNGSQRSRGVELELAAQPSQRWYVITAYAFSRAELTEFSEFVPSATGEFTFVDRSGQRAAFAPEQMFSVWSSVTVAAGLELGGGARYTSGQFIAADNGYEIDGHLVIDATAAYRVRSLKWQLYVRNLSDTQYETRGFGNTSVIPAAPLALHSSLEWSWE